MSGQAKVQEGDCHGWVTEIHLRQPAGISHEVAYANALDACQALVAAGYDVTLKPTLPDIPVGAKSVNWGDDEPEGSGPFGF